MERRASAGGPDLKQVLVPAVSLQIFKPDKPIIVKTDASKHAVPEEDGVPASREPRKTAERKKLRLHKRAGCVQVFMR